VDRRKPAATLRELRGSPHPRPRERGSGGDHGGCPDGHRLAAFCPSRLSAAARPLAGRSGPHARDSSRLAPLIAPPRRRAGPPDGLTSGPRCRARQRRPATTLRSFSPSIARRDDRRDLTAGARRTVVASTEAPLSLDLSRAHAASPVVSGSLRTALEVGAVLCARPRAGLAGKLVQRSAGWPLVRAPTIVRHDRRHRAHLLGIARPRASARSHPSHRRPDHCAGRSQSRAAGPPHQFVHVGPSVLSLGALWTQNSTSA